MIDLHAHILPGLDDGPAEMSESIQMCRMAYKDGVRSIVATPHMNDGMYNITASQMREKASQITDALAQDGVTMNILPGGDISLTPETLGKLQSGEISTVAENGVYVMLELPNDVVPVKLHETIFEIQSAGYIPIISHIERYSSVQTNISNMEKMVEWGVVTQLTAASIIGEFGKAAKECSMELIKCRLGHVVASDMHGVKKRPPGQMLRARRLIETILSGSEVEMMFDVWPEAIIKGELFDAPDPVKKEKKWWRIFN